MSIGLGNLEELLLVEWPDHNLEHQHSFFSEVEL